MKSTLKTGLSALVAVSALLGFAPKSQADVNFEPHQSGYPRGTTVTLEAQYTWFAGEFTVFQMRSDGNSTQDIGYAYSNGNGQSRLSYRVPTAHAQSNVYISAWSYNWIYGFWEYLGEKRLPIG